MPVIKTAALFLILSLGATSLFGCTKSTHSGSPEQEVEQQTPPPPPPPPPIDYSMTFCISIDECKTACDLQSPWVEEVIIKTELCPPSWDPNGGVCGSIIETNETVNMPANESCKLRKVTEVIDPAVIDGISCLAYGPTCQNKCATLYAHLTKTQIQHQMGATGAALKKIYAHQLLKQQYDTCLGAPAAHIMGL